MKKKLQGGFTLIELLVVIAIIGILASVVLASLNTARNKGADAKIKSELSNMRAQAEIEYDNAGQSYDDVCTDTTIAAIVAATAGAVCYDDTDAYAISAQLKSDDTKFWCVDSTGAAVEKAGQLATNATAC